MTAPTVPATSAVSKLTEYRGPKYPPLGAAPALLAQYVKDLLSDTEADANARYRQATRHLLFSDGKQHIDWNTREKTWKPTPTFGATRVTMNYIRPILRSRAQRLMSSELSWRVIPPSNAHEDRDKATVATNLIEARYHGTKMDAKVRRALFLADNCGVAYLKQFWNPNIGQLTPATMILPHPMTGELLKYPVDQQGNVIADDLGNPLEGTDLAFTYRPGDTDTALRSIFNIRLNPDALGLEPDEGFRWLLDTDLLPISVVKEMWKERADKVQSTAGVPAMRVYERLVKSITDKMLGPSDTFSASTQKLKDNELTLYTEYWEAPTDLLKTGRLIVIAGEELIYPRADMGDPEGLPQGIVPHVAIYSERAPLDSGGRAVVKDLCDPQVVINSQWEAILLEQRLSGIGQFVMFDVPGLANQITNAAAAHIKVPIQSAFANKPIGDLIQRLNPSHSSPDRWHLIEESKKTMFDIGAFHEIQRGQVPPGVDSGIAVQLLQEAENGQMHDSVRDLKESLKAWARQTGKLARWGYGEDEERWIPNQRPDLGYLVTSIKGSDLPDFDQIDIDLEGFRPTSQAAFNAEIKEAMAQGWMDPRQGLQMMDLGRGIKGAFESQNRHYNRARNENLAIQKVDYQVIAPPPGTPQAELGVVAAFIHLDGAPFLLPQDDDHLVHMDIHQEIALDDSRPWEERQAALLHIAEHRALFQIQLQAMQPQEEPGAEGGKPGEKGSKSKSSKPTPSSRGASNAA